VLARVLARAGLHTIRMAAAVCEISSARVPGCRVHGLHALVQQVGVSLLRMLPMLRVLFN
jgi:hypothetical protein